MLCIGLQIQNRDICHSNFYVEREIRDKQSKSKTSMKQKALEMNIRIFCRKPPPLMQKCEI